MEPTLRIDRRFCGPPESGNGGYVCGRLARFVDGEAAVVRLHVPPPLEVELAVRRTDEGATLLADETVVAEARPMEVALEIPAPPDFEAALAASRDFRGFDSHWFPTCFVCGPERGAEDGLRIFPGPLGPGVLAAPWVPDATLAAPGGFAVASEFLWAALDCPGAFAFAPPERGAVLLGELRVALFGEVQAGERCVLVAWEIAHRGRKHETATVLYGESGAPRGAGVGIWLEVAQDRS